MDSYWDNSLAFFIPSRNDGERIEFGKYSIEKFKECLKCLHFDTAAEAYVCRHADGKKCLLQLGVNYFEKK